MLAGNARVQCMRAMRAGNAHGQCARTMRAGNARVTNYPRKNAWGWKITCGKMCAGEKLPAENAPVSAGTKINRGTCAHFRGPARISVGNQAYEHPPKIILGQPLPNKHVRYNRYIDMHAQNIIGPADEYAWNIVIAWMDMPVFSCISFFLMWYLIINWPPEF